MNAMDKGLKGNGLSDFLKKSRLRHAAPAHQSIHSGKTDISRININAKRKYKRGNFAPFVRGNKYDIQLLLTGTVNRN